MLSYRDRIILDTLLPAAPDQRLPGLFDTDFDGFYERFRREAPAAMRVGFAAGLLAAAWIAPLLTRRPPPITLYDRDTRERMLHAMTSSRFNALRQLGFVLRATCSFHYGAQPEVRVAVGFPEQFDAPRPASFGAKGWAAATSEESS